MATIYINGKFTRQQTTGVQRVAGQWLYALDDSLGHDAAAASMRWVLLLPPGAVAPVLRHVHIERMGWSRLPLFVWEQVLLPLRARTGTLLSLAGSAPLLARRQACTFHDAAVFDRPQAYSNLFRWWYRFLFRRLATRADLLFTVSAFSRQRLLQWLPAAADRLHVVPNGAGHFAPVEADPSILDELGLQRDLFVLVVGSANPNKNVARTVEAFRRLPPRPGLKLVVVGVMDNRVFTHPDDDLPASAGNILRPGAVNDARLKALYTHAACLVFASLYEGFGLPAVEAMWLGCPVIAARSGALPEVCGVAALFVDAHSTAELTMAIDHVLREDALRERLREAGWHRSAELDWAHAAQAMKRHLRAAGLLPQEAA